MLKVKNNISETNESAATQSIIGLMSDSPNPNASLELKTEPNADKETPLSET
ncbi:hypothetical protein N9Y17_00350 [Gammaproteobacteria bacterium]|nr:hypothetical protein [Gammaproteobacteria bacterium]